MEDERPGSHAERVAATYDLFAAQGTTGDRDHLTLARAAQAIGASRSHLYRLWDSSAAFAEDTVAFQATPETAWQHEAESRWGSLPIREALAAALVVDEGDAVLRSSVSVRPPTSRARALVATWERAWLNRFAARLRVEYGQEPDEPWTDIAVSLVALVEGMFLLRRLLAGSPDAPADDHMVDLVVSTVDRIARYLGATARGDAGPLEASPGAPEVEPTSDAARRILQRTVDALRDGTLERDATDRRLVDMEVLARALGMSSRRLYALWPTAADLNAELFGECIRRVRLGIAEVGLEVFGASDLTRFNHFTPLMLQANTKVLDVQRFPDSRQFLAMIELATHPEVLGRFGGTLHEWFTEGHMMGAALLHVSGRQVVPGFSLTDHTVLAVASELGGWRMVALHEELMDRRIQYLGETVLPLSAGIDAHTEVWTEHDEVAPEDRATPPIPDRLTEGPVAPG